MTHGFFHSFCSNGLFLWRLSVSFIRSVNRRDTTSPNSRVFSVEHAARMRSLDFAGAERAASDAVRVGRVRERSVAAGSVQDTPAPSASSELLLTRILTHPAVASHRFSVISLNYMTPIALRCYDGNEQFFSSSTNTLIKQVHICLYTSEG